MLLMLLSSVLTIGLFDTPLQASILYYLPFFLAGFVQALRFISHPARIGVFRFSTTR